MACWAMSTTLLFVPPTRLVDLEELSLFFKVPVYVREVESSFAVFTTPTDGAEACCSFSFISFFIIAAALTISFKP